MKLFFLCFILTFSLSGFSLDEQDAEILERFEIIKTKVQLHDDEWGANYTELDVSSHTLSRDIDKDITDWKNVDEQDWLDITKWKEQRIIKDKVPNWKEILRNQRNREVIGRVIKCLGVCSNYRGAQAASSDFQTVLREGDEFFTDKQSYAWLVLLEGSLIRLSPKTSITLTEINLGVNENLLAIRLNQGHIHYQGRLAGKFTVLDKVESDTGFYPLMLKQANREFYAINEYRSLPLEYKPTYSVKRNPGHQLQYKKLNELLQEYQLKKTTKVFIYAPNVSLLAKNVSLDLFYNINSKTMLKYSKTLEGFEKLDSRESSLEIYLRGYENSKVSEVEEGIWFEIDKDGKSIGNAYDYPKALDAITSFPRRIPSIHIAREIFMRKYSQFILQEKSITKVEMMNKFGYRLWDSDDVSEISRRISFLKEYVRRVETTNLKNISKVFKEQKKMSIDKSYFQLAMSRHYNYIKTLYNRERKLIFEMNDTQYYMWLLKYGTNKI